MKGNTLFRYVLILYLLFALANSGNLQKKAKKFVPAALMITMGRMIYIIEINAALSQSTLENFPSNFIETEKSEFEIFNFCLTWRQLSKRVQQTAHFYAVIVS